MSSRELERLMFIVFWIINGKLKMAARQFIAVDNINVSGIVMEQAFRE
jgi:hypothetical protein